jgi:predicted porin
MKKTLVAMAALASVSAFAQSTVTLSGNLDVAGASYSGTMYGAKGTTFTTAAGTASTSVINIIASEDLGGGTKITGKYGIDPRSLTNDGFGVQATSAVSAYNTNPNGLTAVGLGRDEVFLQLETSMGSVKLGAPNSVGLDINTTSSPLGTGVGSGYGLTTKSLIRTAFIDTRYDRSIRLDSAVMNGIKASALYAPGNDELNTAVIADTTNFSSVARNIPNNRKVTELGLNYANGPLNVQWLNYTVAAQTYATGYYGVLYSTGAAATTALGYVATKSNMLAANYNLGATTLYGAWWSGDSTSSTTAVVHVSGNRYAVKQNFGAIDVALQYTQTTLGSSTTTTSKAIGARADYNLSKTAAAYVGYENVDTGAAATTNTTSAGVRKITSIGLRKSF